MAEASDLSKASDGGFAVSGVSVEALAWGVPSPSRSYWPARAAVLAAMLLYIFLPDRVIPGPRFIVPAVESVLLVVISLFLPHRTNVDARSRRTLAVVVIGVLSVVNIINLALLVDQLLKGALNQGRPLIIGAVAIWLTNIIVFGLWYWELDRGGPYARHTRTHREPDFLFPQMATPGAGRPDWAPSFIDYLYVSLTNATAFSPTDTMPLTTTAKLLMGVQAAASLLTVAIVAARAVNILS